LKGCRLVRHDGSTARANPTARITAVRRPPAAAAPVREFERVRLLRAQRAALQEDINSRGWLFSNPWLHHSSRERVDVVRRIERSTCADMWPHAGTSQRVLARGGPDAVTAQSPDQGADAQGSRDAAEPWTPLARVWLLVGAAPTRRYISHLSLALPRAWQALASAAHFTLPRGVPRSSTRTPPP